jgi:hypothetical protein
MLDVRSFYLFLNKPLSLFTPKHSHTHIDPGVLAGEKTFISTWKMLFFRNLIGMS